MDVPILGNTPQNPISSHLNKGEDIGPQIRLLICHQCKTVDELPDYPDDADPRGDVVLKVAVERNHTDALTGVEHVGRLGKVPVKYWAQPTVQKQILQQIQEGSGGLADVDEKFYETRSTFFDDAMACFNKHLRPKGRCPDWRDDSKRLVPDTNAERKDLGLAKASETGPKVYLCDFCPAKTYMITRARTEAGMYDK